MTPKNRKGIQKDVFVAFISKPKVLECAANQENQRFSGRRQTRFVSRIYDF
jgi:hypothetical protein